MTTPPTGTAELVAQLNDLIQLDNDALRAYTIAIDNLENDAYRETLRQFSRDHERHIVELENLIRARGGHPLETAHLSTGMFKLTLQQVGRLGGDRGIVLAFETNERQVRDKYWRAAERAYPPEVQAVLRRAAADEDRHYSWGIETLRRLGSGSNPLTGRIVGAAGKPQARTADTLERAERAAVNQQFGEMRAGSRASDEETGR